MTSDLGILDRLKRGHAGSGVGPLECKEAIDLIERLTAPMTSDLSEVVRDLRDALRVAPGWKSYEPNPLCQKAAAVIERLSAERGRIERNRDMWKGQVERQAEQLSKLQWQPIETAPKDGTHILAYRVPIGIRFTNLTNPPTVVHWFDDPDQPGFYTSVNEMAPANPFDPTHWMPLPSGPALKETQHVEG